MNRRRSLSGTKERSVVSKNTRKKNKGKREGGQTNHTGLYGFLLMSFGLISALALISNLLDASDNILGKYFGYYLSKAMTGLAGNVPALLFPVILFIVGWGFVSQGGVRHYLRTLLFLGIGFLQACIFLSIRNLGAGRSWEQFYSSGGLIGNFIVQNIFSLAFGTQKVGAYLVMTLVIMGTLIWGLRIDVYALMVRIRAIFDTVYAYLFDRQAQLAFSGASSNPTAGKNRNNTQRGAAKKAYTTEVVEGGTAVLDEEEEKENKRGRDPENRKGGISPDEMTDEEIDKLPVSKALAMRLEKKQREFLNEYSGPVIREMEDGETPEIEDDEDETIIVDKVKEAAEKIIKPSRPKKNKNRDLDEAIIEAIPQDENNEENRALDAAVAEVSTSGEKTEIADGAMDEVAGVSVEPPPVEEVVYDEYVIPEVELLEEHSAQKRGITDEEINANAVRLIDKLKDFKINGVISEVCPGPVITRYELQLAPGTKVSKVESLSLDLAVAMAVQKIRISLVPGKSAIGIELPNPLRQTVFIKDVLKSPDFKSEDDEIKLTLGKDIAGKPVIVNLVKMPHLLIAGTTGSGKSVCTNSFLASILLSKSPEEVKLILIDPKVVEMTIYNGIPHLLSDVITTPKEAISALKWAVAEMNRRYQLLAKASCRNIAQFNAKIKDGSIGFTKIDEQDRKRMPYIVVIIDELADLMLAVGKELEEEIVRIAQKSRAIGIHLVLATQRPEAKVVTGLIKSNMPSRIALMVNSAMDSRIIMDDKGAEELLGMGDMLYKSVDMRDMVRVHGCFIETRESEQLIEKARTQNVRRDKIKSFAQEEKKTAIMLPEGSSDEIDELKEAARIIVSRQQGSTSLLQRRMSVGYAKAGRLMDQLEAAGIVGPNVGSKSREVLIQNIESVDVYLGEYVKGNNLF